MNPVMCESEVISSASIYSVRNTMEAISPFLVPNITRTDNIGADITFLDDYF